MVEDFNIITSLDSSVKNVPFKGDAPKWGKEDYRLPKKAVNLKMFATEGERST